jgi:hypothetical protein
MRVRCAPLYALLWLVMSAFALLRQAHGEDKVMRLSDQDQAEFSRLCDVARYASRIYADQACAFFQSKMQTEPKQDSNGVSSEKAGNPAPKGNASR